MAGTGDDKRERILEAALVEFGEKDYGAASVRRIAEAAGVAKGTIYLYFPDKSALFSAAAEHGWELFFRDSASLPLAGDSPAERLGAFVEAGFARLKTAHPLLRGMLLETSRRERLAGQVLRLRDEIARRLGESLGGKPGEAGLDFLGIFVAGVLFEIAMTPAEDFDRRMDAIRATVEAALAGTSRRDGAIALEFRP